jgi:ergothioneine biosynthesis protein EgtB
MLAQSHEPHGSGLAVEQLAAAFTAVRRQTQALCEPLETEDYVIQSMPDASPVKWHLAHTTWFFETFVLAPTLPEYRVYDPRYRFLFNSYYDAVGPRWPRPERGVLSRPTVTETYRYRAYVDQQMQQLWPLVGRDRKLAATLELGIHHEQQHQELMLTDLKHAWAVNPFEPIYRAVPTSSSSGTAPPSDGWLTLPGGVSWIGHEGSGFAFDNETPRHRVFQNGFRLARKLVTNREYLAFMNDDGYDRPELWLSAGWAARQEQGWNAPLYWRNENGAWSVATLAGHQSVDVCEPVCHVSYYEADAFARWAGARLPTEAEWEAAAGVSIDGNFLEGGRFHPTARWASGDCGPVQQMFGDVWQWTKSPYVGYPGYIPPAGALGEYNGKFMCNQIVLRGASCVTPRSHARRSYRNFFPPEARWQFSGVRLAKDHR